jgi:hypothetical protein
MYVADELLKSAIPLVYLQLWNCFEVADLIQSWAHLLTSWISLIISDDGPPVLPN